MALTYSDIHDLRNHPTVIKKVHVAIADVAKDILAPETNGTVARSDWAKEAIKSPSSKAPEIVHFVLLENLGAADPNTIITAADAAYKTNVGTAVDSIVGPTGV